MKILNLSFNTPNLKTLPVSKKEDYSPAFDSLDIVSFTSNYISQTVMENLCNESKSTLQEASSVLKVAKQDLNDSDEILKQSKKAYDDCMTYIDKIYKNPHYGCIDLDDGKSIKFRFILGKDRVLRLFIDEFNERNVMNRTFVAVGLEPKEVRKYGSFCISFFAFDDCDNFDYYSCKSLLPSPSDEIAKIYSFKDGMLAEVQDNVEVNSNSTKSNYLAIYSSGNLVTRYNGCIEQEDCFKSKEKFDFDDNELVSKKSGFQVDLAGKSSWDLGYYFDDNRLSGYIKSGENLSESSVILFEEAFLKTKAGKFEIKRDSNISAMTDGRLPILS
ncbi:MAG: hypothetical protein IKU37_05145 [Candidatus Gastranaerophilales bacterium]|nr:hypothetical protein [Candidatus Gastranaerophilales bacterium]